MNITIAKNTLQQSREKTGIDAAELALSALKFANQCSAAARDELRAWAYARASNQSCKLIKSETATHAEKSRAGQIKKQAEMYFHDIG